MSSKYSKEFKLEAIKIAGQLGMNAASDRARIAAAIAIIERGWGKAPAEIPAPTQAEHDYNNLTNEELVEELFQLMLESSSAEFVGQMAKKYFGGVEASQKISASC